MNKYETNYITKTCRKNKNRDTWIIKENTHKAIISKEKYERVQEIKLQKKDMGKVKYQYLLRDLLYCGNCKRKLQYKIFKAKDKKTFLSESGRFNCSLFYKKRCKNNICIKEKDLNEIVKSEVIKRLDLIKIDVIIDKVIDYYKANYENVKKITKYKNEIEKLERRKRNLYKEKCEQYISVEEFKIEYTNAKVEIEKFNDLITELLKKNSDKLEEKRIEEIIIKLKSKECINNDFLKEIINRIEVYSKNQIEVILNI